MSTRVPFSISKTVSAGRYAGCSLRDKLYSSGVINHHHHAPLTPSAKEHATNRLIPKSFRQYVEDIREMGKTAETPETRNPKPEIRSPEGYSG